MIRPRLLDLYCCAGGAGMGYRRAGFDVTGVDIAPQPNYPFAFVQADALAYLAAHGHEYDVIHASPPCQSYLNLGAVNRKLGRTYDHADLVSRTRAGLIASGKPYVIENVEGAPLLNPVRICGTGCGLPLRRHRLFESSHLLHGVPCEHSRYSVPKYWTGWRPNGEHRLATTVQVYGNGGGRDQWPAAMGIDWMTPREMCEAIPPVYTEFIGAQLMDHLRATHFDSSSRITDDTSTPSAAALSATADHNSSGTRTVRRGVWVDADSATDDQTRVVVGVGVGEVLGQDQRSEPLRGDREVPAGAGHDGHRAVVVGDGLGADLRGVCHDKNCSRVMTRAQEATP